jgi:hypothetical protein
MQKYQNFILRNKSTDNRNSLVTSGGSKPLKLQLSTLKKSNKPITLTKDKPIIKLVKININNYITNDMTNNVIVDKPKTHRKTISIPIPTKKQQSSLLSMNTIYSSHEQSESHLDEIVNDRKNLTRYISPKNQFKKIIKPIIEDNDYELSARLINDENREIQTGRTLETNRYDFISKIKEEIRNKIFNTRKFLQLPDNAMFNILAYAFTSYNCLISANKVIRNKIHMTLNMKFNHLIREFRNLYKEYLELQEYYFKPKIMNSDSK